MFLAIVPTNVISITGWTNIFRGRSYLIKVFGLLVNFGLSVSRIGSAAPAIPNETVFLVPLKLELAQYREIAGV